MTNGFFIFINFSIASECFFDPGPEPNINTSLFLINDSGDHRPVVLPLYICFPISIKFLLIIYCIYLQKE